jgi:twinkle protein
LDRDSNRHYGQETYGRRQTIPNDVTPISDVYRAIPRRGLTKDSIEKYQIDINMDKDVDVAHRYPYFKDGHHIANKVRRRETKDFYWEGLAKGVELYGQNLFPAGGSRAVTIVEGELDAASAYQLLGSKYPVVSVTASNSAVKDCKANYEYLNAFDKIVICFDKDEAKLRPDGTEFFPGQEAAEKVAALFQPGKCAIMTLQQGKDPNDYLQNKIDPRDFIREWWQAPVSRPDGIKAGSDMWEEINSEETYFSVPYPWPGLQRATYGMRLSEAVLLMADTGLGKTKFFHTLELAILNDPTVIENGWGVGILHFEETNKETALHLMGTHVGKPYHLPDTEKAEGELRSVYDEVINTERLLFYDHFGSNEIDVILNKIRHMAVMGCKYIFVDHLSIIVSDQSGDERKDLDEISTKLKMLTVELNIGILCIIHTNRNGEARGSAGPEKVANVHLLIEREKEDTDPIRRNITKMTVKKCRLTGRTGPVSWIYYDPNTHQLSELDEDAVNKYEMGAPLSVTDLPWST